MIYQQSTQVGEQRRAAQEHFGSGLTSDRRPPGCDEQVALRHPEFGAYGAASLACNFVEGDVNGPEVSFYDHIDYVAWFLSADSRWLPAAIRDVLTRGLAEWGVWPWHEGARRVVEDFGFREGTHTGAFGEALRRARSRRTFRPGRQARQDLEHRLAFSSQLLRLSERGETLADRLMDSGFLDAYFEGRSLQKARRR